MPRDSQRSKVYKAERLAWHKEPVRVGESLFKRPPDEFATFHDAEVYLAAIMCTSWVAARFDYHPEMVIKLLPGRAGTGACARYGGTRRPEIKLSPGMRDRWVVLHELAHVLSAQAERMQHERGVYKKTDEGRLYRIQPHGWEFCETYLALVRHFLGVEAAKKLKAHFKECRVRFTRPRPKRVLTEEQREVLRSRMAALRALRQEAAAPREV